MRRLKKSLFLGISAICLVVLAIIRMTCPGVMPKNNSSVDSDTMTVAPVVENKVQKTEETVADTFGTYHRIYSVPGFERTFPDLQEEHYKMARKYGVTPVNDRQDAEKRKKDLVYVGTNPYYDMDTRMKSSIPYLVPRAANLLQTIGRAYMDSLAVKGIPLHKIIVTSVLRTQEDLNELLKHNHNASTQSCHRYGTTFDISQNRYNTVCPPGESRRAVSSDTLKWVLSEVLRDLRAEDRCLVKYEVHQGCFHVTTR